MATDRFPPGEPHGGGRRPLEMSAARPADIVAARHAVTAHLQRAGCSNIGDAVLVLSELVTNAVLHAGGASRILVACSAGWVHISVHDRRPGSVHPRHDGDSVSGRGLQVVDAVAEDWGARPLPDGKAVWALVSADIADTDM